CESGAVQAEPLQHTEDDMLETEDVGLVEVVIAPRSDLAGSSLRELEFRQRYGLTVAAIWRQGQPRRTWLAELPLQYGDALLLLGPRDRIRALRQDPNFISLDEPLTPRRSRMGLAALAVVMLIVLGTSQVLPLSLAALLAAGVVVLGGCISAEEVFQAIDWRTVIVIGGLIPLGMALHTTGAAAAIAQAILPQGGAGPVVSLAAVLLVAVVIGHFVPSVPTTIVVAPIALSAAAPSGTSPVPFMITVASATSVTLLTPISHPASLMVMGPGGYRLGDYARLGAPLALLLGATLLAVVSLVWKV
ncbi:MAG: SLC13 family permease, partial [Armatimonadota bacterium]|nr:SLC13 family permease [Armatimonadota bacterium]